MSLVYAKIRLAEWAMWSRDKSIGYPHASVGFGGSRGGEVIGQFPLHVELVDVIVRQMEVDLRRIVIVAYTQYGTAREKALRLGRSPSTYYRMLREGQEHVGIELDYAETYGGHCVMRNSVAYSG